jgi:DNA polymerase-3 subunit gamma/tau
LPPVQPQPRAVEGQASRPDEPPSGAADALADQWAGVARRLVEAGMVSGLVRELAWQSSLLSIDQGPPATWRLCIEHEALRTPALAARLGSALGELLGHPVVLELKAGTPAGSPAQRDAAERERRQREAELTIEQDPVVRELMAQFRTARIVPGSIKPV